MIMQAILKRIGMAALWAIVCLIGKRAQSRFGCR